MKRFWLVLLLLGLVMAFSVSAFAVDVKVSGEFDVGGLYLDKTTLNSSRASYDGGISYDRTDPSTAFFYQKLQVGTEFIVSPSLKLATRFNAMERIWGGSRSAPSTDTDCLNGYLPVSAGTRAESENIAFDYLYILYTTPIGTFNIGYQRNGFWGTVFGDTSIPAQNFGWSIFTGKWFAMAQIVKAIDNSKSAV